MFKIVTHISEKYLYGEKLLENITEVCKILGLELIENAVDKRTMIYLFKDETLIKEICGTTFPQLIGEVSHAIALNI